MAQLSNNPMLMQQYCMIMQNPNLNPQMYNYFMQTQMQNMQTPIMQPQVIQPQIVPNTYNNVNQTNFNSNLQQQSNLSPNLQQRTGLHINSNFNNGTGSSHQNDFMANNNSVNLNSKNNDVINTIYIRFMLTN